MTTIKKLLPLLLMPILFSASKKDQHIGAAASPNVVIIFMDDMGYGDIEPNGAQPYHTPHLNSLAAEGMRFTQFYAAQAVCSASRSGLLTGCYPTRIGINGALVPWSKIALNPNEETIAELLKKKGYATGMVGKWHLGCKEPFLPLQNGFDEYFGLPYSNDMWPIHYDGKPITDTANHRIKYPPLPLMEGNKTIEHLQTLNQQTTLTERYTQKAVKFITDNKNQRFFLYLAHSMPHVPLAAGKKFAGKSGSGLYGDVMEEIDWSVGEIMKTLEQQGLKKNTLIIFSSDNGPWITYGNHAGSTGGLREGKGTHWDGGLKVPCIMSYPGIIPQGTICNKLASTIDVLPTLAALCKAPIPKNKIDGVNLLPILKGNVQASARPNFVYYYDLNNLKAVRNERFKLVFNCMSQTYKKTVMGKDGWPGPYASEKVKFALYDLMHDPGENLDVQQAYPQVVKELEAVAEKYRQEIGDGLTNRTGNEVRPAAVVN